MSRERYKPLNDNHRRILVLVATDGPINPGQIGRVLMMSVSTVNAMLMTLRRRGLVTPANREGYTKRSFIATTEGEKEAAA